MNGKLVSKYTIEIVELEDGGYLAKLYYEKTFTTMSQIIGVLESVKQEFYRRVVAPYEEEKIKENGDVI
ncbi:MAG TPA: hypothetical protein PLC87_12045 [Bacteroidales bacterium]|nr:hypothetical protein [Bacteroidales bacterium]